MARLCDAIKSTPVIYDAAKADADWRDLMRLVENDQELAALGKLLKDNDSASALLKSIFSASPYLTGLILREPKAAAELLVADVESGLERLVSVLQEALQECSTFKEAQEQLRGV